MKLEAIFPHAPAQEAAVVVLNGVGRAARAETVGQGIEVNHDLRGVGDLYA